MSGLGTMLTAVERKLLLDCANGHDIRGSDRVEDRAKQRLRRLGLISYKGRPMRWRITDKGDNLAEEIEREA